MGLKLRSGRLQRGYSLGYPLLAQGAGVGSSAVSGGVINLNLSRLKVKLITLKNMHAIFVFWNHYFLHKRVKPPNAKVSDAAD
jgi:hypothetical protein